MRNVVTATYLGFLTLLCGWAAPAAAEEIPMGSYLQSCRDVRVSAGWLHATCQDRQGRWVESTTAPSWCSRGDIANEDGRLQCKQGASWGGWGSSGSTPAASNQPPRGSYMATCRDIRVSAGWLHATCQDRNGRWVDATTAASWCTGRDIMNDNGRLTCR